MDEVGPCDNKVSKKDQVRLPLDEDEMTTRVPAEAALQGSSFRKVLDRPQKDDPWGSMAWTEALP